MHSLAEIDAPAAAARSGQTVMVERSARRCSMPPLVRRDVRETYSVIEGEMVFFVGDDAVSARAGDVVVAPAGVPRSFRVDSDSARWTVLTQVRALDRYVDFGRAVSTRHADASDRWPSEEERAAVAAMCAANGIELLGPPGTLPAGH